MKDSGTWGWLLLSCAAALNFVVATLGVWALISGPIDPSRRVASWIVFSVYVVFGLLSLLALAARWRNRMGTAAVGLRNITFAWTGVLCLFSLLAVIFKWAV